MCGPAKIHQVHGEIGLRTRKRQLVIVVAALAAPAALPGAAQAAGLALLGQSNLGGGGMNGEVATVGNTAVVAAGILPGGGTRSGFYNGSTNTCPATSVKVVDVSSPSAPTVKGTIPVPAGVAANDVAALHVATPSFTGDLAAVALVVCNGPGNYVDRGVGYYNITDPANPTLLGRYEADANQVLPGDPPCTGVPSVPPNPRDGARCASSAHQVSLVQRPSDGKVLSLSTEPGASSSQDFDPTYHGDLRIVDVTNPTAPTEIGSYPNKSPAPDQRPPGYNGQPAGFSNNGCRPFNNGIGVGVSPDGSTGMLAYFDAGLLTVGLTNPAAPTGLGQYAYPSDRAFEGNASYVDLASVGGRSLALLGESDWIAPSSSLRIDAPNALAGSKFTCEAMWTLFDPANTAQVYRHPNSQVPGTIVYAGRGCPGDPLPAGVSVSGKIAFRDRNKVSSREGPGGSSCSGAAASKNLQDQGAIGVVVAATSTNAPQAISFDGDPTGQTIPTDMIDTGDANALRDALCPAPATAPATNIVVCAAGGVPASGAMVDSPGSWGALRVVDVTDPTAPTLRGVYQPAPSQVFPPPDLGVYSVHHAVARGSIGFVAGHANGLRVIDLTSANPTEIASFVPPDTPDPTNQSPGKANVTGVDVAANGAIVVSDTNSGLYVLGLSGGGGPGPGIPTAPGPNVPNPLVPGAPVVSGYRVTNNPFVVSGAKTPTFGSAAARARKHRKGTAFRYTLSESATVKIVVAQVTSGRRRGKTCVAPTRRLRKARRCTRILTKGTLTRTSRKGVNSVAFSGRIGSRALRPGRYRATLTATDAARKASVPRTIAFTIVAR